MRVRNEGQNERQKSMRKHLKRMLEEVRAATITQLDVHHETGWKIEDTGVRRWSDNPNRTLTIRYTVEDK